MLKIDKDKEIVEFMQKFVKRIEYIVTNPGFVRSELYHQIETAFINFKGEEELIIKGKSENYHNTCGANWEKID